MESIQTSPTYILENLCAIQSDLTCTELNRTTALRGTRGRICVIIGMRYHTYQHRVQYQIKLPTI